MKNGNQFDKECQDNRNECQANRIATQEPVKPIVVEKHNSPLNLIVVMTGRFDGINAMVVINLFKFP